MCYRLFIKECMDYTINYDVTLKPIEEKMIRKLD